MKTLALLCLVMSHFAAHGDLDQYQKQGMGDTQRMLRTPTEREAAIKGNKIATDVDQKVGSLAGSKENKEQIYDLAAQVLEKIAAEAKGDPEKMQRLLLESQSNPKGFYDKYFSEEQKNKVRSIANDIEKKGKATSVPPR